jgi:uncharacterized protein (TIGR00255 family)
MALSSMTGFARCSGLIGAYTWGWELRSVNGRGLELRLRLPLGWEALEPQLRAKAAEILARGTIHCTLSLRRHDLAPIVKVNEPVLEALLSAMHAVAHRIDAAPARLDGILGFKGIIELMEQEEDENARLEAEAAVTAGFADAVADLAAMRRREGSALGALLDARLEQIGNLAERAEAAPGRRPEAIRVRLAEQIALLLSASDRFDTDRLHQEAVLLAAKADVREEIDRLDAHVRQGRELLAQGGAIGRRLDFLAQEMQREANTLCAKANDLELTSVGLELKTIVEQFREQVQNLE